MRQNRPSICSGPLKSTDIEFEKSLFNPVQFGKFHIYLGSENLVLVKVSWLCRKALAGRSREIMKEVASRARDLSLRLTYWILTTAYWILNPDSFSTNIGLGSRQ